MEGSLQQRALRVGPSEEHDEQLCRLERHEVIGLVDTDFVDRCDAAQIPNPASDRQTLRAELLARRHDGHPEASGVGAGPQHHVPRLAAHTVPQTGVGNDLQGFVLVRVPQPGPPLQLCGLWSLPWHQPSPGVAVAPGLLVRSPLVEAEQRRGLEPAAGLAGSAPDLGCVRLVHVAEQAGQEAFGGVDLTQQRLLPLLGEPVERMVHHQERRAAATGPAPKVGGQELLGLDGEASRLLVTDVQEGRVQSDDPELQGTLPHPEQEVARQPPGLEVEHAEPICWCALAAVPFLLHAGLPPLGVAREQPPDRLDDRGLALDEGRSGRLVAQVATKLRRYGLLGLRPRQVMVARHWDQERLAPCSRDDLLQRFVEEGILIGQPLEGQVPGEQHQIRWPTDLRPHLRQVLEQRLPEGAATGAHAPLPAVQVREVKPGDPFSTFHVCAPRSGESAGRIVCERRRRHASQRSGVRRERRACSFPFDPAGTGARSTCVPSGAATGREPDATRCR